MGKPFPMVEDGLGISQLGKMITRETPAVVTRDRSGGLHVITEYDLIQAI